MHGINFPGKKWVRVCGKLRENPGIIERGDLECYKLPFLKTHKVDT